MQDLFDLLNDDDVNDFITVNGEMLSSIPNRYGDTAEHSKREKYITKLLEVYVDAYSEKVIANKKYRCVFFWMCVVIVVVVGFAVLSFLHQVCNNSGNINDTLQVIAVCITGLGAIIGLAKIIAKHLFPLDGEKHIAEIVHTIQNNTLQQKMVNISNKRGEL